jgi:hypothetical protein
MKAINILVWINGQQHSFIIDMVRQGQLDQNAMPVRILIISFNQAQELFLAGLFWQTFYLTPKASSQG